MNQHSPNNSEAVLILSEELDYHGVAVRWGLERMGVAYTWWERSEFPRSQRLSAWIAEGHTRFESSGSDVSLLRDRYRTIWNRRGQIPQVADSLNRSDKIVAKNESAYVLDSLGQMLTAANPDALIVNPFHQAKAANPKLHQLAIARDLGFRVPSTLVSNDPDQIRAFFEDHDRTVVAKQHIPFAWRTRKGELLISATTALERRHLEDSAALAASPMIYQELLPIRNEIRLIAFGRSSFAMNQVRKTPVKHEGFVDIRYENVDRHAFPVDARLAELCRAYMDATGLMYAAFDIAQAPDGGYVFIEANESGQFLFLEDLVPDLTILDAFCQFLASGDRAFRYLHDGGLRFAEFEKTDIAARFHEHYNAHMKESEVSSPFELAE